MHDTANSWLFNVTRNRRPSNHITVNIFTNVFTCTISFPNASISNSFSISILLITSFCRVYNVLLAGFRIGRNGSCVVDARFGRLVATCFRAGSRLALSNGSGVVVLDSVVSWLDAFFGR